MRRNCTDSMYLKKSKVGYLINVRTSYKSVTMPRVSDSLSAADTFKRSETLFFNPDAWTSGVQPYVHNGWLPYFTLPYFLSFSTKGMTGPTVNLLSSSGSVSHILSLPPGLDNGINDVLAKNTIDLHDAATIWPSRSLERRRAFQHLLNRCIEIMGDLFDETTLTYDLDTIDRFFTDAKMHFVKRPHVSAARNE